MSQSVSPRVLVIEFPDPANNIILALEQLEENNRNLKRDIDQHNEKIDWIRRLLGGI